MAKVTFATLKIEPTTNTEIFKATVRFRISFNQADHGKKFNYSIRLRRADLAVGEPAQPDLPSVLYRFKFGDKFSKRVTGGPFTTVEPTTVTRLVPAKDLNEDPGLKFTGPKEFGPQEDEIFASVLLTKGDGTFVQFIDEKHTSIKKVTV
ncbi:MAG TPA: hypothetical protein VF791_15870 [Pyrinomonadaceae bacterium]